jgi:hypothetical protein
MTTLVLKAIKVPRMTRVTWYKHRTLVLGIPGMFLLAAALLVIAGLLPRHWISAQHFTYCQTYSGNGTSSSCLTENSLPTLGVFGAIVTYFRTEGAVLAVFSLAAVAGLFGGVPWVAREFEGGGFRFTWTQSVSPLRWLLGTFGLLTLLAAVAAAICGVAAHWWFQVTQFPPGGTNPWGWESIETTPLSMASWTLLAMALALLLGVLIRRVLPAMVAFAVTFGGCVLAAQTWLPEFLFRVGESSVRIIDSPNQTYPEMSYIAQTWFARPGGPKLNPMAVVEQLRGYSTAQGNRWLAQRHLSEWIAYQPHSHLVWLVLARNGILVAFAALAVLASVWWLRKHPAE